jgi:hypothetical protein
MDLNRKERTVLADKMAQSFTDKRSAGSGSIAKKPAKRSSVIHPLVAT